MTAQRTARLFGASLILAVSLGGGSTLAWAQTDTPSPTGTAICVNADGSTKMAETGFAIENYQLAPDQVSIRVTLDTVGIGDITPQLGGFTFKKAETTKELTDKVLSKTATGNELLYVVTESNGKTYIDIEAPSKQAYEGATQSTTGGTSTHSSTTPSTAANPAETALKDAEGFIKNVEKALGVFHDNLSTVAAEPRNPAQTVENRTIEAPAGEYSAGDSMPLKPGAYTVMAKTNRATVEVKNSSGTTTLKQEVEAGKEITVNVSQGDKLIISGSTVSLKAVNQNTAAPTTSATPSGNTTAAPKTLKVNGQFPQRSHNYKVSVSVEGLSINADGATTVTKQGNATLDVPGSAKCTEKTTNPSSTNKSTEKSTNKSTNPSPKKDTTQPQQSAPSRPNVTSVPAGTIYR